MFIEVNLPPSKKLMVKTRIFAIEKGNIETGAVLSDGAR
jgi:hypothetical protein